MPQDVYAFDAQDIKRQRVALEQFRGKCCLIVEHRQRLRPRPSLRGWAVHQTPPDRGLVVLGFLTAVWQPDPGSNGKSCQLLPAQLRRELSDDGQIDVNGANASPCTNGSPPKRPACWAAKPSRWNFTKFLVAVERPGDPCPAPGRAEKLAGWETALAG